MGVMIKYKYTGAEYTWVKIAKDMPKVRVEHGETIISDLEPKYFKHAGFERLGANSIELKKAEENLNKAQQEYDTALANVVPSDESEEASTEKTMTAAEARAYLTKNEVRFNANLGDAKVIKLAQDHMEDNPATEEEVTPPATETSSEEAATETETETPSETETAKEDVK